MQSSTNAYPRKSSELRLTQDSNLFSQAPHSRLYESIQLQSSSFVQAKTYDATYKQNGFPKLYSFEQSTQGKSRVTLDAKSKYSFRNDYSKIVEDNSALVRENAFLREEANRLSLLLDNERRNATGRIQVERLSALLVQKDTEIRTLNQRIFVLQSRGSQVNASNEWQAKYNESQLIINQLNVKVTQITQQLTIYQTQITQLNQQITQLSQQNGNGAQKQHYEGHINQLNIRITQLTQQLSVYESQIQQFRQKQGGSSANYESQVNQFNLRISQLTQQISAYEAEIQQLRQQKAGSGSANYESQINQLNITINQYKQQISQLTVQINEYQSRITILEQKSSRDSKEGSRAGSSSRSDAELNELRNQLGNLSYKLQQYEEHIEQYERTFAQYESQITTLQQVNWKLQERISKQGTKQVAPSEGNEERWVLEEGKLGLKVIILLQEINRLKQKQQELSVKSEELHAYLLKAENYIEEIQLQLEKNNLKQNVPAHIVQKVTHLEQQNIKYSKLIEELQSRISVSQVSAVSQDEYYGRIGERDLRIIILLEEINRMNQKTHEIREYLLQAEDFIEQLQQAVQEREAIIPPEVENQIKYLSDENHRLNLLIENYISEIKHMKVNIQAPNLPKVEYQVSVEIESRLSFLTTENERLSRQIVELQNRSARVETKVETKIEYKVPADIESRISTLTQQNSRLSSLVNQLQSRPVVQSQPVYQPNMDTSLIEQEYAKAKFRTIVLLEQINRLNFAIQEVSGYLVNAENFIFELEQRMASIQQQTVLETKTVTNLITNTVEVVPEYLEREMAKMTLQKIFLLEQINRLNSVVKEIHEHLINAENYIQQCETRFNELQHTTQTTVNHTVEFRIPPEVDARILQLTQQNQTLNRTILEIQNRPARVQTKIEQKVEFRIPPEIQNRINLLAAENQRIERELSLQRGQTPLQDDSLTLEYGKLHFRSIVLLEEINRLNFVIGELKGFLQNAENYIFEIENRQQQVGVPAEVEEEMMNLRQENQKLHAEINRISLFFEQQIVQYKSEISTINTQLASFRSQASTYKSRASELERLSSSSITATSTVQSEYETKWAAEHFRVIVLLEEINRLNKKWADIDGERVEVIGHLVRAQNYIQELESRLTQVEEASVKQSTITTHSNQGSEVGVQQLRVELVELESMRRIEVAARDLRIIFLLEQINRLNQKVKSLSVQSGSGSSEQIWALRQQNEQCQGELHEVLGHLRNAEDYIGELLRQSEGFAAEREQLIEELNRFRR